MHNQYAGFGIRLVATIIDSILLLLIVLPILYIIDGSAYLDEYIAPFKQLLNAYQTGGYGSILTNRLSREPSFGELVLSYGLPAVAAITFWIYRSATPGKIFTHLVIVDMSTKAKPTNSQLVIRYLAYYISLLPFGLGFLWMAWDPHKQGWHDKIARTCVIYKQISE